MFPLPGVGRRHLYVHTSGWVMAYYLKSDPVGKIFDWQRYTGGATSRRRVKTSCVVVSQIGIAQPTMTFYHFQYPNATHMLMVADHSQRCRLIRGQSDSSLCVL